MGINIIRYIVALDLLGIKTTMKAEKDNIMSEAILYLCSCGFGLREACAVCSSGQTWACIYIISMMEE